MKETARANRRIARHMDRIDAATRRCWQEWEENDRFQRHDVFSDESDFQLGHDDHRGRVCRSPEQRADSAFNIARPTGPQPEVIVWYTIYFDSQTLLVIIRAYLQHSSTSTTL
ncbi:hypothetical protein TNCV_2101751 [Trichonephila clavipes]|nr:hypothetical protein TNCV_2101751 [Trichonephila clavipes]